MIIDDFEIGSECIILSEPKIWSNLCNDNCPFTANLKYPYSIVIKDKKTLTASWHSDHIAISCDNYGWDLKCLIDNNLIIKKNMQNKFPFELKKSDAEKIISIACDLWKSKLSTKWSSLLYQDSVKVDEQFYVDMRSACTRPQNELFDDIFGKDNQIDFSILNDEDIFVIKTSDACCIFKGSNPFSSSVLGYNITKSNKFLGAVCSKNEVLELRLAYEKEKEIYYNHYPKFKVSDWVYWVGIDPIVSRIKAKHDSHVNCWVLESKNHDSCDESYLRVATPEEIKKFTQPIEGELYFVRDDEDLDWQLAFASSNDRFFNSQLKKNLNYSTTWKYWVKAEGVKLPE